MNVKTRPIEDVVLIGLTDPKGIEIVAAVVVPRKWRAVTDQERITFCKERLASFKCPKRIVVVDNLITHPVDLSIAISIMRSPPKPETGLFFYHDSQYLNTHSDCTAMRRRQWEEGLLQLVYRSVNYYLELGLLECYPHTSFTFVMAMLSGSLSQKGDGAPKITSSACALTHVQSILKGRYVYVDVQFG